MNSLNLRVSSVKTGENIKKNAELRTSKIEVPADCLISNSHKIFVEYFQTAHTVPDQVSAVKHIYLSLKDEADSLLFLTNLYFSSPLKHPVRNQIAKLLQGFTSYSEPQVISAINTSLQKLLESTNPHSTCNDLNKVTTSLSGCFENFKIALRGVGQNIDAIFKFLENTLSRYIQDASFISSPSAKNEIYLFIHNLIRFVLACIQEFLSIFSDDVKMLVNNMSKPAQELILDPDMPMDVKTNCGILLAYTAKMNDKYINYILDVAKEDPDKQNNCLVLCRSIGVINTISYRYFQASRDSIEEIISNICTIANKYSSEPSTLLAASRILFQISKLLLSFDLANAETDAVKGIQSLLTSFVLSYLEHHIDSVRHICKDLIRNIIKLNSKLDLHDLQDQLFDFCKQDDTPQSLKYTVLIAISNTIGTKVILERIPTIVDQLLASGLQNDLSISNCFENLMIGNYKEVDFTQWRHIWIIPLIKLCKQNKNILGLVEILINKAIKCDSKIVDYLIDIDNKDVSLSTRLSALWTVRKNGLQNKNFQTVLEMFSDILKETMISNEDDTKIMALRLVVESHKTTEPLSNAECETLLEFLKYNSNCQSPAIRQRSLALILKGLVRLQVCLEKAQKDKTDRIDYYRQFLRDLIKLLVNNLFVGANFSRRSVSLTLLNECVKIIFNCRENIDEFVPDNIISKLIDVLNDSYESNKALAVSILKLIIKNDSKQIRLETIKDLMISVRPTDSLTAAYFLEFYCLRAEMIDFGQDDIQSTHYPVEMSAISWCLEILTDGLKGAQKSLLQAARNNPLYGSVLTIRHLISKLDMKLLAKEDQWRSIFSQLIKTCKNVTQVVGPIVNSDSPEGHLPNDFSEMPEFLGKNDDKEINALPCKALSSKQDVKTDSFKTTPQMVLLCGWRTIKEVSLLLGEIVLRSPIQMISDLKNDSLVTVDQIMDIGEHFKKLLSETKHRGAFEQAYVGFSKVCTRLWRTEHPDLYQLPMLWLNDLIEIISKDEKINEKICATRRSAGIPFMVQALITSELQVGTTKALTSCMKHLFSLCADSTRSTESRTHALNILRALFRCSDLNEAVGEYVADGVICAIRGYSAITWAEKNSSTLLFSALITRVFGVQRTKDWENLTIRNRMTGRIFFLRYPKLYDFFLVELKEASCSIQRNERPAKLHPLLLILSRLYPSALEGTESNLKVSAFVDFISICSGSAEMTTRILTAKAIVAFMTLDTIENRISEVFEQIKAVLESETHNQNYAHGLLLQILFMIKSHKTSPIQLIGDILQKICEICQILKPNPVTWKVCLDIVLELLKRQPALTTSYHEHVKSIVKQNPLIFHHEFSRLYPVFRKSLFITNLYLTKITSCEGIMNFLAKCFQTSDSLSYEETETCLNIVLLILFGPSDDNISTLYECSDMEIYFVKSFRNEEIMLLQTQLKSNKYLREFLNEISVNLRFYPECTAKSYGALSQLPDLEINLTEFVNIAQQYPDNVRDSMAKCLESYVCKHSLSKQELRVCLEFLEKLILPWNADLLRLTAAKIVHNITLNFFTSISTLNVENLLRLVNIILYLSRDDDSDVRDSICKTIVELSSSTNGKISASYAPIVLTRYLCSLLKKIGNVAVTQQIIEGIFIAQINELVSVEQDDEEDGEVFDKNEANVFAEPYKTMEDCIETFSECFCDDEEIKALIHLLLEKSQQYM